MLVYLNEQNKIAVCGNAVSLTKNVYELGSIFVESNYRGKGFGKLILLELQERINSDFLVLTAKPSKPGNAGMIIDAIKAGFVPVPYSSFEEIDQEAKNECCCCDSFQNGSCLHTDSRCIVLTNHNLLKNSNTPEMFLRSETFRQAVPDERLRRKIFKEMGLEYELHTSTFANIPVVLQTY